LRVIQEGKIRRIGGNQEISINIRYISATNLSMDKILDDTHFRRDLYYRLCVVFLQIPPLRERKEDILPLIDHYLKYFNFERYSDQTNHYVRISKTLLRRLIEYDWPGNIRELRNIIERIVILSEGGIADDKKNEMWLRQINGNNIISLPQKKKPDDASIEETLNACGNVYEAAQQLGIAPSTIYRKIKSGKILQCNKPQLLTCNATHPDEEK